jgi:hypothetical protein
MFLSDKLTIDARRRTRDGYMVVSARVAQFDNVQLYAGSEVGRPEKSVVRVYRPRSEVTDDATMHSFGHRPVTIGHPSEHVTAATWRDVAKGWTDGDVQEEGKFIRVNMLLADAEAIKQVEDGTRELSMGYDCSLEWTAGTTPSGEAYDAIQRGIRSNHVAIVAAARGGPELRIGDSAPNDRSYLHMMSDSERASEEHRRLLIGDTSSPGEQYRQVLLAQDRAYREPADNDAESAYQKMVHDMTNAHILKA